MPAILWFIAFLPDGLDAHTEVVEDMAALDAATSWQETTDEAGDMAAEIEFFRIGNTNTLHMKTETTDAWQDNCLAIGEFLFAHPTADA